VKLIYSKIPKAQKDTVVLTVFLLLLGSARKKNVDEIDPCTDDPCNSLQKYSANFKTSDHCISSYDANLQWFSVKFYQELQIASFGVKSQTSNNQNREH
jgi:hypothetical protein